MEVTCSFAMFRQPWTYTLLLKIHTGKQKRELLLHLFLPKCILINCLWMKSRPIFLAMLAVCFCGWIAHTPTGSVWNIWKTVGWTATKFCTHISSPQSVNPHDFGDLLTAQLVSPTCQNFHVSSKMSQHLLDVVQPFVVPSWLVTRVVPYPFIQCCHYIKILICHILAKPDISSSLICALCVVLINVSMLHLRTW